MRAKTQKTTPPPRALNIFVTAEQFLGIARLSIRLQNFHPSFFQPYASHELKVILRQPMIAYMAIAASSLELYLKCLLRIGRKTFKRNHDLKELFNILPKKHKSKIRKYWINNNSQVITDLVRQNVPESNIDFDFVLELSNQAFVIMRYAYEGIPPRMGWAGDTIIDGVRQRILEMHPEWEPRGASIEA